MSFPFPLLCIFISVLQFVIRSNSLESCWIEKGGGVLDFSNGKAIATTKRRYYELGEIPVKGYKTYTYTPTEAAKKMVDTGHWGPWDSKPPR